MEPAVSTTDRSSGLGDAGEGNMQQQVMTEVEKKQMKVMVAIDESEASLDALKWALDNLFVSLPSSSSSSSSSSSAAATTETEPTQFQEHGTVILVHVQLPFPYYIVPPGQAVYETPELWDSVRKAQEQSSAALMDRALKLCNQRQVKAQPKILNGEPKEKICEAAEQIQPTVLVVGSRGLNTIKRVFLGSVSDYCAHHANCPILVVRPQKGRT